MLDALTGYIDIILPVYIHNPTVAQATVTFVVAVINAAVVYLSTEEQNAPQ